MPKGREGEVHKILRTRGYLSAVELSKQMNLNMNTIAQWKRRHKETFPKAVEGMYREQDIKEWLVARNKWSNDSRNIQP